MKVLVTGAKGFVGRNLCLELGNIRDGKARCYGAVEIDEVFEYDITSQPPLSDEESGSPDHPIAAMLSELYNDVVCRMKNILEAVVSFLAFLSV